MQKHSNNFLNVRKTHSKQSLVTSNQFSKSAYLVSVCSFDDHFETHELLKSPAV